MAACLLSPPACSRKSPSTARCASGSILRGAVEILQLARYPRRRARLRQARAGGRRLPHRLLKPQSAFFERFGSAGFQALEELCDSPARAKCWCCSTASAATSTPLPPLTPKAISRRRRHCASMRSRRIAISASPRSSRSLPLDRCGRRRVRRGALVQPRRTGVADCAPRERRDRRAKPVPRDHRAQSEAATEGLGPSAPWSARPARTQL